MSRYVLSSEEVIVRGAALALAIPLAISAVCIVGPIGFVGLVAPHIARLLIGETGRGAMIFCMLAGAVIVIAADILARTLLTPQLLQVGTVMALCGGVAFLAIVVTSLRRRPTWTSTVRSSM